jgi:ubiquinone/menaquinone biosynthesis C-methylase UbiE
MLVEPLEGYRMWAATYDAGPNPLLALERRVLTSLLGPLCEIRVLDVACGTGYWTHRLGEAGAITFGFDLCDEMLKHAQRKGAPQIRLFLADASAIPLRSETADLTLCSFAASYFFDLKQAMTEMARVTRAGGRVIISDMHPAAMAAGWSRSFRKGRTRYEIEHTQWNDDSFRTAGREAGLRLEEHFDEGFGEPERALFAVAHREHLIAEASRIPAIRITTWIRL